MARYGFFDRWPRPALAALLWLALATPAVQAQAQPQALLEALAADDTGLGHFPVESTPRAVSLPDDWARSRPARQHAAVVPVALRCHRRSPD